MLKLYLVKHRVEGSTYPTLAATLSMMFMDLDLREQLRKPGFYFKLIFGGK